jgi:DNA-binding CsgD family transcriptional regulator
VFVSSTRSTVAALLEDGLSVGEVAVRLGLAANTVRYHQRRLLDVPPPAHAPEAARAPRSATWQVETRAEVQRRLARGERRADIARTLGLSKATVSYHARRLGAAVDERCARRYDWAAVQRFYDTGRTVAECVEAFGFSKQTWHAAIRRGAIVPRPSVLSLVELCAAATPRSRGHLKQRLIAAGVKAERCEACGLERWRDAPLRMALHHVNGDRLDNRIENLALLCPNCHSQTDNFAGRNRGRAPHEARGPTA